MVWFLAARRLSQSSSEGTPLSKSASWRWSDAVTTTAAVRYVGEAFNNDANTVVMDEYTLIDLRASWRLTDAVELYGRVENLFDEHYQQLLGYGEAGLSGYAGIKLRY